ncbi:MAG: SDR family NAD(P)-dependent oxidoreductase [Imperialibacter sp.]|uniref:SDR family NAD(P)-dependent oxidoreductase n=1 Tax=Imperialibacter sp. TaxID=2038411 RepID=UPI0032EDB0BC
MEQNNYQGALQQPIGSGFNAKSTASEVIKGIDLTGKVAIVTGGGTGIGLETAKVLAGAGATVIVAVRDIEKAEKSLQGIANVELKEIDLINPESIDAFAECFLASGRPLHLLINNAGIMWVPLRRDSRGIESQLAVNYLGQFHLVAKLWPALLKANGARVVNVSSQGHQFAPFNFEDPHFESRDYETLQGYGQSKTASNLFSVELDSRARQFNIRAYAVHPGSVGGTDLAREAPLELFQQMGFLDAKGNMLPEVAASLKTVPQGAATTIWCATSPLLNNIGGVYCEDADIAGLITDSNQPAGADGVQAYSLDKAAARRLWDLSEELTGVKFAIADEQPKSAAAAFKEFLTCVSEGNPEKAASFFAEDGYLEAPYVATFGMPSKFEGHEQIAGSMKGMLQMAPNFHFTSVNILMETPTEVVAEYESEATLANGRPYKMLYMGHITTKDGKITSHREFLNTVPFVEAFFPNGLKDLITQ